MDNKSKLPRVRNMNVKYPDSDYTELQKIADDIGLSLSSMIRMLTNARLKKVRKTGNSSDFLRFDD